MQKRVTIKQVADVAGVSTATVTRVLHDSPKVKTAVRERVIGVINDLNYEPSIIARSLKGRRTGIIALDLPTEREMIYYDYYTTEVLRAVIDELSGKGYSVYQLNRQKYNSEVRVYNRLIASRIADGVIIANPSSNPKIFKKLLDEEFPFVLLGEPPIYHQSISYVDAGNEAITYEAVKYLSGRGRKKIALLNFVNKLNVSKGRLSGYKKALGEEHIKFDIKLVVSSSVSLTESAEKTRLLLTQKKFDAIVCGCDHMALGAVRAIKESGARIPEDIAVIGANNTPYIQFIDPPLTSFEFNIYKSTRLIVEHLIRKINNEEKNAIHLLLKRRLVERASA